MILLEVPGGVGSSRLDSFERVERSEMASSSVGHEDYDDDVERLVL